MTANARAHESIQLLASGVALGHYIPAVLVQGALLDRKLRAQLHVYEAGLSARKRAMLTKTRDRYQDDFRAAQIGQRLHGLLNADPLGPTATTWYGSRNPSVATFVVFSGQWAAVLAQSGIAPKRIVFVQIDIGQSPSWKQHEEAVDPLLQNGATAYQLSALDGSQRLVTVDHVSDIVQWPARERVIVVHGGGWALGPLDAAATAMAGRGWRIQKMLGSRAPSENTAEDIECYTIPGDWAPWKCPVGRPFPPLFAVGEYGGRQMVSDGQRHQLLKMMGKSCAVVCKPGGMSLAESALTATPLLFLDPYGPHESENAAHWIAQGFGLPYMEWIARGSDPQDLVSMHRRLVAAVRKSVSLVDLIAERAGG